MPQQPILSRSERQLREGNSNWRGGRSIASNGYVLIRVGTDHPMADVRGYVYEHRLVASEKIGRLLLPGEQVHHIDENKQNNAPENLTVCHDCPEHKVLHRKKDVGRRMPGEPNPVIACECGCGQNFEKFDDLGRPRRFTSGHNPQPALVCEKALSVLASANHPVSITDMAASTGQSAAAVRTMMIKLVNTGKAVRVARGLYLQGGY